MYSFSSRTVGVEVGRVVVSPAQRKLLHFAGATVGTGDEH